MVSGQVPAEMSPQRGFRKVCGKSGPEPSCVLGEQESSSGFCLPVTAQCWGNLVPAFFWMLLVLEKVTLMMNPEHGFLGHRVMSLALAGYVTLDEPLGSSESQFLTVHGNNADIPCRNGIVNKQSSLLAHKGSV